MNLERVTQEELDSVTEKEKALPDRVREIFDGYIKVSKLRLLEFLDKADSPIEQMMLIALSDSVNFMEYKIYKKTGKPTQVSRYFQIPLETNRGEYRADFLIEVEIGDYKRSFVIECDGHEFHEKTKEQAKKDRQRERALMEEGYIVIRFTGSEIYDQAFERALEAMTIIEKHLDLND